MGNKVANSLRKEIDRLKAELASKTAALEEISMFHKKGRDLESLEKKYGFLGWTCCGQLRALAKLSLRRPEEGGSKETK